MLRKSLANIGLRVHRPQQEGIQRAAASYGHIRRRDASSSTAATAASSSATIMGDNVKLKTMDDLGGPSFLTTLNWLFVKGYFKTTQQMQVSEDVAAGRSSGPVRVRSPLALLLLLFALHLTSSDPVSWVLGTVIHLNFSTDSCKNM